MHVAVNMVYQIVSYLTATRFVYLVIHVYGIQLILLYSERPKLYTVLAFLSAKGLKSRVGFHGVPGLEARVFAIHA